MAGVSGTRPEPDLKKAEQAQEGCSAARSSVITSQEAGVGADEILPHRATLWRLAPPDLSRFPQRFGAMARVEFHQCIQIRTGMLKTEQ